MRRLIAVAVFVLGSFLVRAGQSEPSSRPRAAVNAVFANALLARAEGLMFAALPGIELSYSPRSREQAVVAGMSLGYVTGASLEPHAVMTGSIGVRHDIGMTHEHAINASASFERYTSLAPHSESASVSALRYAIGLIAEYRRAISASVDMNTGCGVSFGISPDRSLSGSDHGRIHAHFIFVFGVGFHILEF